MLRDMLHQKTFLTALLLMILPCLEAEAWVGTYRPRAMIDHTDTGSFSSSSPILLVDVDQPTTTYWLDAGITTLSTIRGYAHAGQVGESQGDANAKVDSIQIWGWKDSNGDGEATVADSKRPGGTTRWTRLAACDPNGDDADPDGNVLGWEVAAGSDSGSDLTGNLLQNGQTIAVIAGEPWILIVRVVDTSGFTNLHDVDGGGGIEQWDDGDTGNGIGSDVPGDKYTDKDGNTPGTSDARLADDEVVFTYIQRSAN
jgi:hypothetical protein